MNWYIKVHNGMSKAEYIAIKIKLLNSTQQAPDDASNSPSPEREIISLRQLVAANSTWLVPVNWTIAGTDIQDSYTSIKKVAVNNRTIDDLDIRSSDGRSFRVVIELWKYDSDTRNFTFAWSTSSHEQRSVWNQIWFKVKS